MSETDTETEQERKTREFWSKAYDGLIANKDKGNSRLQYEPTAVLSSQNNKKQMKLRDILDVDLTR